MSAVGSGASYELLIQGASKRVDFVGENYLVVKSLGAGLFGSGLVYFGKSENEKAAGYALLGISGASGASKLSTVLVTSDTGQVQGGIPKLQKVRSLIGSRRNMPGIDKLKKMGLLKRPEQGSAPAAQFQNRSMPEQGVNYDMLAYADTIYSM